MTTDAKIGLLLALVFIIAITFVINGLPAFLSKTNKEAETTNYVNHYKEMQPALVGQSRNIAPVLSHKPETISVLTEKPQMDVNSSVDAKYQALMPAAKEAVKTTQAVDANANKTTTAEVKPAETKPAETKPAVAKAAEKQEPAGITYVVQPGDNLAEIAQKMYGPQIGKKQSSIDKIFNANKKILPSRNSLQVGQTLIIPDVENKTNPLLKTGLFEKASDKTTKLTLPPATKTALVKVTPKEPEKAADKEQFRIYVVKESDSLWQIAQKELGNGSRYDEIENLNPSIDPDRLEVGAKLKLPAR